MNKDQKKEPAKTNTKPEQDQNLKGRPDQQNSNRNKQLTKEDLPDSTNESRGNMGSGQRQDSN